MRVRTFCMVPLVALAFTGVAPGQLPQSRLKSIFPPAAQAGTTTELRLTSGDDLEDMATLHFSHPGITGSLRTQEVHGKPRPVENTFDVTISADVPPGMYEVRASGPFGVTNPRRFAVGHLAHIAEVEPNNTAEQAQAIPLECSVVGRLEGGTDIDLYRLRLSGGERVVIDCVAERLDSMMDASITIRDSSGRRIAWANNTRGDDPTLAFDPPGEGEYLIEIHDQTFRSGNEYVYRLDVHTGPHVVSVMPPAGPAGQRANFTLYGYNLPGGRDVEERVNRSRLQALDVAIDVPAQPRMEDVETVVRSYEAEIDAFSYRLQVDGKVSNPVRLGISSGPVTLETEPNDEPAQAVSVSAPGEAAGQISKAHDFDWFRFPAKAGEVYWIEVIGQRNGNALDPVLLVDEVTVDAEGKETVRRVTSQDDDGTNVAPNVFDSFTDDPVFRLEVARDATYRVAVYDRYGRGDPRLTYRLAIRPDQPDFRVVAVPAINQNNTGVPAPIALRKGDTYGIHVYALRRYGYTGPIDVRVEELPPGISSPGTTIGTNETSGYLVLHAVESAVPTVSNIRLISTARIEDPAAVRGVDAAAKAIVEAEKPLVDLRKKADDARLKQEEATRKREEAAKNSSGKPDDENLKKQLEAAEQALAQASAAHQQAREALMAAETSLAHARAALNEAEQRRVATIREVTHPVRFGALMTLAGNNIPSEGRLAQSLPVSVVDDVAHFEVRSEPQRLEVCQSRQVLVSVSVVKRNGFNEKVALTVNGLPRNSNIEAANIAIEKDQSKAVLRILVKDNTPPGTYVLWLTAQGQISYSRNPARAVRFKQEQEEAAQRFAAAQEASKAATEAKTQATQKAAAADQALQQARQAQQQADQVAQQKTKEAADAAKAVEAATGQLEAARKAQANAREAETAARQAAGADAENDELQKKVAEAEAALAGATAQLTQKETEHAEAAKKMQSAQAAAAEATKAQTQAVEAVKQAEVAKGEADKLKQESEAAEKAAQAALQAADAEKKAADKRATDAENAAKPQNKNHTPPSMPVVLTVVPAPVKLTAVVAGGGNVKRGESTEVTVKAQRLNGFDGPIELSLPLPPGVSGLTGLAQIPADQTEVKLVIQAAGDATEGELANIVVRGTVDSGGKRAVDVPIALKVNK